MRKISRTEKTLERIKNAEVFSPDISFGLTDKEVKSRVENKLTNRTKKNVTKSYWKIFYDNVFNFFNILLICIFVLLCVARSFNNLFFMGILLLNTIIGIAQDIKARKMSEKLRLITNPKAFVIREGKEVEISTDEVVLSDIVIIKQGDQICADGVLLAGEVELDESLLTGESINVTKKKNDLILSGTVVLGGQGKMIVTKVGYASYVETLGEKARSFNPPKSEILRSLNLLFRFIGALVIIIGTAMFVLYGVRGLLNNEYYAGSIANIAGSLIGMIPSGLYLLTSLTLTVGIIRLAKRRMSVQQLYSIEMLSRVDTLCLDKTGTITDGSMNVKDVVVLDKKFTKEEIGNYLKTLVEATKDENATAKALITYFKDCSSLNYTSYIPFMSKTKYSAVMIEGGKNIVLGAKEFLLDKDSDISLKAKKYEEKGLRVLVVASLDKAIKKGEKIIDTHPLALIVLIDHIKEDAIPTIEWFKNNNVKIKIISGDNVITTANIAQHVGVEGANKFISLENTSLEELASLVEEYNVFGRVSPEQKEIIIDALRKNGHVVAMTGDGVNDLLALKKADCSIAMASGSQATKNTANLVSLDSDFNKLPDVVKEGRRVINNLQRTASLFLVKTGFAVILSIFFYIWSIINPQVMYPFVPANLYVWEIAIIGLASFFLTLEPNDERIKSSFLKNVLFKALPASFAISFVIIIYYILAANGVLSKDAATTLSILTFTILAYLYLLLISFPYSIYRIVLAIGTGIIIVIMFLIDKFFQSGGLILSINYDSLTKDNFHYLFIFVGAIVLIYAIVKLTLYLIRRKKKNANSKEGY